MISYGKERMPRHNRLGYYSIPIIVIYMQKFDSTHTHVYIHTYVYTHTHTHTQKTTKRRRYSIETYEYVYDDKKKFELFSNGGHYHFFYYRS